MCYIDIYDRFRGPDGGYADFIDGVQVRTPDGIHFSREGGDQIAQVVLDTLNQTYDLTSWRSKVPATTVPTTTPDHAARPADHRPPRKKTGKQADGVA